MRTVVDDQLRREASEFRLRFTCEDCAHFAPERGACAHGYPNEAHRSLDLTVVEACEFCKEFELV
jgi:hypothetical protein